jgi:hypothetical protein
MQGHDSVSDLAADTGHQTERLGVDVLDLRIEVSQQQPSSRCSRNPVFAHPVLMIIRNCSPISADPTA